MKALKSKTIGFALALAVLGALQVNLPVVQEFLTPQIYGWMTMAVAVSIAALRAITTTSLAEK